MKTTAVRLYGKGDLRLEQFELPEIAQDEILAHIISDSICMSSYKAAMQGSDHKRVPNDIDKNPVIIGHEFCGEIVQVGAKWTGKFQAGDKFSIQPAMFYPGREYEAPGYSFRYCGGGATYVIIPREILEMDCLLKYNSDVFFYGSLAEPMSCIVGGYHANYHSKVGTYDHVMGIKKDGKLALLAGVGPMGLGAINYALNNQRKPSLMVVTDIDQARLDRAASIYTTEYACQRGVKLVYLNTSGAGAVQKLMELSGGTGYDDVFVYAPVKPVVEQGDKILGHDGCLNFFAGPTNPDFSAEFNFYNVHYGATHIAGTSGGNTNDMIESIEMMNNSLLDPAPMITHVGGLDSVIETTLNLPKIPGGKKLCYNNISLPMTAISDFSELGKTDPLFAGLDEICRAHNGLWCGEAEKYLLANAKPIG